MPRKNSFSADNQQERLKTANWIVGFTDGEGCFTVSVFKNPTTKSGWQIFPEFVVTQGKKSLPALELMKQFFNCGIITINKRHDNHKEHLYRYCVRNLKDLEEVILPFFRKNSLRTAKERDFKIFAQVTELMREQAHLKPSGFKKIVQMISQMNRKKIRQL